MNEKNQDQNSERLVAGPSRVPGTMQVRQPIVAAGIGTFVIFFGLMLWFIASKLGTLTQNQPQVAAAQAPGVISSAQPARPEDIGAQGQSNALPTPQVPPHERPAATVTLAPGDLTGSPVTPVPVEVTPPAPAAVAQGGPAGPAQPSAQQLAVAAEAQRRQRVAEEARAAAQSDLDVKLADATAANGAAGVGPGTGPPVQRASMRYSDPDDYIVPPPSEYLLRRGMVIPATLYTSIDSTIGGTIIAYVNQDIYDSRHRTIVVPKGAKLTGSFGGVVIQRGQARIPVAWDSIQLRDDSTIVLENYPGIDLTGTSGLGAKVDNHTRKLFGNVLLLSLLEAGAQLSQPQNTNCGGFSGSGCFPTVGQQIGQAVGNSISQAGAVLLSRDGNIQPTLHTVEGSQVAVMVERDMPVRPWEPR